MAADIKNYVFQRDDVSNDETDTSKAGKKSKVTDVFLKKAGHLNPVIVTFQNGKLNEKYASDLEVVLSTKEDGMTNVVVKTPSGHVFKDSNFYGNSTQTEIIAIRNKKTKKIRLVEVEKVVLINSELLNTTTSNATTTDYAKDYKALHRSFGVKRVVTRIEQREKVNVNSMLVTDEVKGAIADLKVENTSLINNSDCSSILDLLPPNHRDAKTISEVYLLNEIFSKNELDSLKAEIEWKKEFKAEDYSEFFLHCYEEAKKLEENLPNRLAGVLFIDILLNFFKIPSNKLKAKKLVLCPFSNVIHVKIMNEFCIKNESGITRPMYMKDKILCYIIALSLVCCNYKVNLKLLAAVSSVSLSRLARLACIVGATPLSKDNRVFVFKLPLQSLPKTSSGKMKRK